MIQYLYCMTPTTKERILNELLSLSSAAFTLSESGANFFLHRDISSHLFPSLSLFFFESPACFLPLYHCHILSLCPSAHQSLPFFPPAKCRATKVREVIPDLIPAAAAIRTVKHFDFLLRSFHQHSPGDRLQFPF